MLEEETSEIAGEGLFKRSFAGHSGSVLCVLVTKDDQKVITGSEDQTVHIWDIHNGSVIAVLRGHYGAVHCLSLATHNHILVSGSGDETLKVWDMNSYTCLQTFQLHKGIVQCCVISQNNTRLISGADDSFLKIWDLTSMSCTFTLTGHSKAVLCACVTKDDRVLVSGSADHTLKVWNLQNEEYNCINTLQAHSDAVTCCTFNHDDSLLVTGSHDMSIRIWDYRRGLHIRGLPAHHSQINCCTTFWNGESEYIISGSGLITQKDRFNTLRIFDMETGKITHVFEAEGDESQIVHSCATSFDNQSQPFLSYTLDSHTVHVSLLPDVMLVSNRSKNENCLIS